MQTVAHCVLVASRTSCGMPQSRPEATEEAWGGDLDATILSKGWDLALGLHYLSRDDHGLGEYGCACTECNRCVCNSTESYKGPALLVS